MEGIGTAGGLPGPCRILRNDNALSLNPGPVALIWAYGRLYGRLDGLLCGMLNPDFGELPF